VLTVGVSAVTSAAPEEETTLYANLRAD